MVDKIVTIKTQRKTLEGIRTVKIIEGKTNEIPHKTLERIRTAKILNIFNIYTINDIKKKKINCVYIKWLILPKKYMKTMAQK